MDTQIRFIVFLIDSRNNEHDGYIFASIQDARNYAHDSLNDNYCTSAILAEFIFEPEQREMMLHAIETINAKAYSRSKSKAKIFKF